jgi:hypothetical protein
VIEPDKGVWTDDDFDRMWWHDASIHGIGFVEGEQPWLGRLLLDIDYVVEWLGPQPSSPNLSFRVAPATLVFEEALGIDLRLAADAVSFGVVLQILRLRRSRARREPLARTHHDYRVEGVDFDLRFTAARYRQYLRARPVASSRQTLSAAERGLPSFSTEAFG